VAVILATPEEQQQAQPESRGGLRSWGATAAAVALPTLLAAALVAIDIGGRSLWLDEAASVSIASQHGPALWAAVRHDGGDMLLYYLLLHWVIAWFGSSPAAIRLPAALATVATVPAVFLVARQLFGRRVAAFAALLTGVSLPLVYWGQNARGYSFSVLFLCLSFFAFIAASEPGGRRGRALAWAGYVVAVTLAVYMSLTALLVLSAQVVGCLGWRRQAFRSLVWALVGAGVLCAPLGVMAALRGTGQLFWVSRPSWAIAVQVLESLTSAALPSKFTDTATAAALLWLTVVLLVGGGTLAWRAAREGRARAGGLGAGLVACWLVVPAALSAVTSLVLQPTFLPQYLVGSIPAAAVALAALVARVRPVALGVAAVAGLGALRLLQIVPAYGASPEDWHAAVGYVAARTQPGDCIAFYANDGWMAFGYYVRLDHPGGVPRSVLPAAPWSEVRPYVEQYASLSGVSLDRVQYQCPRLWLVASHMGQPGATPASQADYARYQQLLAGVGQRYRQTAGAVFGAVDPVKVELYSPRSS
jgi:mannosyltransferase